LHRELHDDLLPRVRTHPDVTYASFARGWESKTDEYLLETHWRSLQALIRFAGDDWRTPRVEPYEEDLLVSVSAHHFVTDEIAPLAQVSSGAASPLIHLEDVEIDPSRLQVQWNGSTVHLPPREMSAMLALASDPGSPVSSVELARRIWPGSAMVTTYDVRRVIHQLRSLLRAGETPLQIRNLHGCGYSVALETPRISQESGQSRDTSDPNRSHRHP